jgi:hypothetical protein
MAPVENALDIFRARFANEPEFRRAPLNFPHDFRANFSCGKTVHALWSAQLRFVKFSLAQRVVFT